MKFFRRAEGNPRRVGVLAGAFNPVTVAHMALARAGLSQLGSRLGSQPRAHLDEVVFALPKAFPHKEYHGAAFADRVDLLRAAVGDEPAFSIAETDGGLFLEIAAECREVYGEDARLTFLCGCDAAERILNWNYGDPDAVQKMLHTLDLLVAARAGQMPDFRHNYAQGVELLTLDGAFDHVSSTEVRERIARGLAWEHLVPAGAREMIERLYAVGSKS